MCIEPRPVSSCPPRPPPFPSRIPVLLLPSRAHSRGCCCTSVAAADAVVCTACVPGLPQRQSHCAAGECLLFSRMRILRPPPDSCEREVYRGARWGRASGGRLCMVVGPVGTGGRDTVNRTIGRRSDTEGNGLYHERRGTRGIGGGTTEVQPHRIRWGEHGE